MPHSEPLHSDNGSAYQIWSDGTTMWVIDRDNPSLHAYDLATMARDPAKDVTLDALNNYASGVWSDGNLVWVSDYVHERIYAYDLDTGQRRPDREVTVVDDVAHLARRAVVQRGHPVDSRPQRRRDGGP